MELLLFISQNMIAFVISLLYGFVFKRVTVIKQLDKMVIVFSLLCSFVFNCTNEHSPMTEQDSMLVLVSSHLLSVSEPSGLTIDESGTTLWTVGSNPQAIYMLDLVGHTLDTLSYRGDDLEGIAYDPSDSTLWVVEEVKREVVHLDLFGNVLSTHPLNLIGEENSGLEGICFDDTGNFFILNEKKPGIFIELNLDLSIETQQELGFANDYSGLAFYPQQDMFWILSDQEKKLYLWSKQDGVSSEFALSFAKAEGIAFNEITNRVYIVSDSLNSLYIYEIHGK